MAHTRDANALGPVAWSAGLQANHFDYFGAWDLRFGHSQSDVLRLFRVWGFRFSRLAQCRQGSTQNGMFYYIVI